VELDYPTAPQRTAFSVDLGGCGFVWGGGALRPRSGGSAVRRDIAGATSAPPVHLVGSVSGTYAVSPGLPDTGATYTLHGQGRTNYGATTVTGSAHGTGFIAQGRCTASITVHAHTGAITVAITSKQLVPGGSSCRSGYAFTRRTTGGTGSFAHRPGTGRGYLDVRPATSAGTTSFGLSFDKG
jgi:hypothetical protein